MTLFFVECSMQFLFVIIINWLKLVLLGKGLAWRELWWIFWLKDPFHTCKGADWGAQTLRHLDRFWSPKASHGTCVLYPCELMAFVIYPQILAEAMAKAAVVIGGFMLSLGEQEEWNFVDSMSFMYILNKNRWIFSYGKGCQHAWTYKSSGQLESGPGRDSCRLLHRCVCPISPRRPLTYISVCW